MGGRPGSAHQGESPQPADPLMWEIWVDSGYTRELAKMPERHQLAVGRALPGLAAAGLEHPQVVRLKGSPYPGSFRLRVGDVRVVGLALPSQGMILLTAAFVKKRTSDYEAAIARHERRLQ